MRRAWLVPLLFAAGCSPSVTPPSVAVFPVTGRLTVSGQPAAKAQVAFHPVGGGGYRPVAVTGPDGTFRLTTLANGDGAPAGEYVVTIFWEDENDPVDGCLCPDPAAHDRLLGLYYTVGKSELRATIKPEHNTITLNAEVGGRGWNLPRARPLPKGKDEKRRPDRDRDREPPERKGAR